MPELRSPRVWLAIAWSSFQLYTAYAGLYDLLIQLPVHVAFAIALGFLTEPTPDSSEAAARLASQRPRRWLDGGLALLALLCAAHYVWHNERLASRMAMVDDPGARGCRRRRALHRAAAGGVSPPHRPGPRHPGARLRGVRVRWPLAARLRRPRRRDVPQADRPADADDPGDLRHPHAGLGHVHLPVRGLRQRDVPRRPARASSPTAPSRSPAAPAAARGRSR